MTKPFVSRTALVLCALASPCACASDNKGAPNAAATADAAVDASLAPESTWSSFGGSLEHSRNNQGEAEISLGTVTQLSKTWSVQAPGVTSTPAVVDGAVYWGDWAGGFHATRVEDGTEIWGVDLGAAVTSSPSVVGEVVYVSDRKGHVHALGLEDGSEIWDALVDETVHVHLWSSPVVVDDVLVVGVAGRGTQNSGTAFPEEELRAFRGAVVGLDAGTGAPKWRFETTIGPDGTEYGAGVSVWSSAAADPDMKAVFIGTGNSYYEPAGPYTDSLLALQYETGELIWSVQFTEGDVFRSGAPTNGPDFDVGAAPNLFEIGDRKAVGVGDKGGHYRTLDRETGEPIWDTVVTRGSSLGGVMVPAAYADGRLYVSSNESVIQSKIVALDASDGSIVWTLDTVSGTFGASAIANGVLFAGSSSGEILALDPATSAEYWSGRMSQGRGGGVSVSGGRVFAGSGFHLFRDVLEPIPGGLSMFSLGPPVPQPDAAPPAVARYDLLSDTGLYDDTAAGSLAPGVEAYEPQFELWSDGAAKRRFIKLPEGRTIDSSDADHWVFPVGTKLWKEFSSGDVRVETRLIEKVSDDEWYFMPFVWNSGQVDADAQADGASNAKGTQHDVPSQSDCTICHNGSPWRVLGVSALQLSHQKPGLNLDSLESGGWLSAAAAPLTVPGSADAQSSLGYLHANCSFCHNPQTQVFSTTGADFRLTANSLGSVEATATYSSNFEVAPLVGGSGLTTARIAAGDPVASTIVFRMGQRGDSSQMPPLATEQADDSAIATISAWISSLGADAGP